MQKTTTNEYKGKRTTFCLFDSSTEMAAHYKANGYRNYSSWGNVETTLQAALLGDDTAAAKSDAFLSRFESLNLVSSGFAVTDEVVGAVPNVPAFLSGAPVNMRLRRRIVREMAPLAIIVDLTTSGGISKDDMSKRGSVILAAARVLSATRPVELWCFVGLGAPDRGAYYTGHRLETSPMDLARAAPCFADAHWARNIGYGTCRANGSNGSWPYNGSALDAKETETILRLALPHLADALVIPPMHMTDPLVANPEKWLADTIALYSPQAHAA
jgi:hypothetical protein